MFANLPVYACVGNLFGQETDTPRQIVLILIDGRTQLLHKQKKKTECLVHGASCDLVSGLHGAERSEPSSPS